MNAFYHFLRGVLNFAAPHETSESAVPPPANPNRVHLFHGWFDSELAATAYCFEAPDKNQPEPLSRDLPDAMIDTSQVEIIFGEARIGAAVPMLTADPRVLMTAIGTDNTMILIAEAAFGGLPYTLNDTPHLRYAGPFEAH